MTAKVDSVRYFPLKGAGALRTPCLKVDTKVGVLYDRHRAIRKNPGDLTRRPEKFNKQDFYVCANTPAMAYRSLDFLLSNEVDSDDALAELAKRIGADHPLEIQDTRGEYHLCDTDGPQVSFLNLATVQALEEESGLIVDPDRFRMNVWIKDLPAFAEYEWVDAYPGTREIMVGDVRMRVDDACERCKAPDANPKTGTYDMDVSAAIWKLMKARGYRSPHRKIPTVMGIYGVVLNDGFINGGDKILLL